MITWGKERAEAAQRILASYPDKRSAVMPLLYVSMAEHGYVSEQAMREVAEMTGLTPVQVSSVASFYSMYKREAQGEYLVSVCTSVSCHLLGGGQVLGAVEQETGVPHGETSADGRFSVEHVECIGACGGAPAVQVNYELVEGVTPEKAVELCRWLEATQPDPLFGDEMQALFGGQRSFDWGPSETEGATGPVPGFGPYTTAGSDRTADA